jgi:hypothetical protein
VNGHAGSSRSIFNPTVKEQSQYFQALIASTKSTIVVLLRSCDHLTLQQNVSNEHTRPFEQPMAKLSLPPAATESLRATLLRTVPLALLIGTIATLSVRGMPVNAADWKGWTARVAAALWITFGGHYIELLYLRGVLPYIATDQEPSNISRWFVRLGARCAVWATGGAVLWIGGMTTYVLIMSARLLRPQELPLIALQGALGLVIIELLGVHVAMTLIGRPSVWLRRDGRWG